MFDKEKIGNVLLQLDGLEYSTTKLEYDLHDGKLTKEEFDARNKDAIKIENELVTSVASEEYIYDGCICKRLHFNELFWSEYYKLEGVK